MLQIDQVDEIFQIKICPEPSAKFSRWASAYFVDGLLIDTGCARTKEELLNFLNHQGLIPKTIVNTHHHPDHIGGNRLLQNTFDAELFAHPEALELIRSPQQPQHYGMYWGVPEGSDPLPVPDVIKTPKFLFEVMYTPGHCKGHITLYEKINGWVFCGDLFYSTKLTIAGPEYDLEELTASMTKLLALPNQELYLLTGLRLKRRQGRAALMAALEFLNQTKSRIALLETKGMTVDEIVEHVFAGESVFDAITNGDYTRKRLVELMMRSDKRS